MKTVRIALFPCLVLASVMTAGCDSSNTIEVTGAVTYDGQPVEKGDISFIAVDGDAPTSGGMIENGKFTVEVTPGKKRVEIRGSRALPPERQSNPEMGLLYEDFIPAIYNRESTLTKDVTADGQRELQFDLTPPP